MIFALAFGAMALQACSTANNETIWVSGFKTDCTGVAETECLYVSKDDNPNSTNWEYFYAPIEGFEFEEGVLQKIEVKTRELDVKDIPADASSIQYTFVKSLEKMEDQRVKLNGHWILASVYGKPINRMVVLPNLIINLGELRINGNGGCNEYFASIEGLTQDAISFGMAGATLKECSRPNIEEEYFQALGEVKKYSFENDMLEFYNDQGDVVLRFIATDAPAETSVELSDLDGEWKLTTFKGGVLNKMIVLPTINFDLEEQRIFGNAGCNNYFAGIEMNGNELTFSAAGATLMACIDENIEGEYLSILEEVKSFEVNGNELEFFDANGESLVTFIR